MTEMLAWVVAAAGLFLIGLGIAGILFPDRIRRFLLGFATSAGLHWLELALRLIIGYSFIVHAPHSRAPLVFSGFGWLLVGTTVVLALIPWRVHRAFAERSVPQALRFLPVLSVAVLVLGIGVLYLAFPDQLLR